MINKFINLFKPHKVCGINYFGEKVFAFRKLTLRGFAFFKDREGGIISYRSEATADAKLEEIKRKAFKIKWKRIYN